MGITVTLDGEAAPEIDAEVERFNEFARTRLGEPLARPEAAIVRTYIAWRLGLDKKQEQKSG